MRLFLVSMFLCAAVQAYGQATNGQSTARIDTSLPVTNVQKIAWGDLPVAAQRTLKSQADGGELSAVAKATLRGNPVYIGSFPSDGNIMEIVVKPDGALVAGESSPDFSQLAATQIVTNEAAGATTAANGSTATPAPASADPASTVQAPQSPPALPNSGNSAATVVNTADNTAAAPPTKLTWSDLPEAVQAGFRTQTDSAQIQEVTMGVVDGKTVYDIRYRDGNESSQARVSATGEILTRAIITESAGATLEPQPLSYDQLPLNVQATVNAATAELPIVGIEQTIVNGRLVYGVTVLQNGRPVQIRVTQDGRVVP